MLGKKSGVAAKILNEVPKALPTHCHAHSPSLSIKSTCQNVTERKNILGEIKSNVDVDIDEEALDDDDKVPS